MRFHCIVFLNLLKLSGVLETKQMLTLLRKKYLPYTTLQFESDQWAAARLFAFRAGDLGFLLPNLTASTSSWSLKICVGSYTCRAGFPIKAD